MAHAAECTAGGHTSRLVLPDLQHGGETAAVSTEPRCRERCCNAQSDRARPQCRPMGHPTPRLQHKLVSTTCGCFLPWWRATTQNTVPLDYALQRRQNRELLHPVCSEMFLFFEGVMTTTQILVRRKMHAPVPRAPSRRLPQGNIA